MCDCKPADMHHYGRWALALLALLPFAAVAQGTLSLTWVPPTTNTDGSQLTNLAGYKVYWGPQAGLYPNSVAVNDPGASAHVLNLAAGTWFSVVTAVNVAGIESNFSNAVTKTISGPPLAPPGPVSNLNVTPAAQPAVTVTMSGVTANVSPELDLIITGASDVLIALTAGNSFDWCKPGGNSGTTVTPTTPALGLTNNDGTRSPSITIRGPVTTRCDIDDVVSNTPFAGALVTVNGIAKPLVNASGVWSASFP